MKAFTRVLYFQLKIGCNQITNKQILASAVNKRTAFVYLFHLVFERECKLQSRIISLLIVSSLND